MAIRIDPAKITLFPEDVQVFRALPVAGNVTWLSQSGQNTNVQADGSLDLINDAADGSGTGGNWLESGPGYLEWTIDAQCLPTSTGYLQFEVVHGSENYQVKVQATQVTVAIGGTTTNISHTAASGDVFRLVIDGQRHLYLNRVLINESQPPFVSPGTPTLYPVTLTTVLHPPMSAANRRIPPVILSGNWPIRPNFVQWETPPEGSITASSTGLKATFSGADTAGEYLLRAKINPTFSVGLNQFFDAKISILPMAVVGPLDVALQPSERVRFRTNYDDAQKDIVTWSESGSGTLDAAHFYTAQSSPGTATVTATYSNQVIDIAVTVPAVITPNYQAVAPSEVVDWETNITSPTWTVNSGSINSSTGVWTAGSVLGQMFRITATNAQTVFRDVAVYEKIPHDPTATIEVEVTRKVLISEADDGSRAARVKNKGGLSQRKFDLKFANRDLTELTAVIAFWERNYPSRPVIYDDKVRGIRVVGYLDSDVSYEAEGSCSITYGFKFVEKA